MSKPGMIQVRTKQDQLRVIYHLNIVAHNPLGSFGIENKIQFKLIVIMKGKGKLLFHAGKNRKAIVLGKRGDLPHDILVHSGNIGKTFRLVDLLLSPKKDKKILE